MRKSIIGILVLFNALTCLHADDDVVKLKKRISLIAPKLLGWCSEDKTKQLVDLVLEVKPQTYVEIGIFGGASFVPVACSLKYLGQGKIIGIDPWETDKCLKGLNPIDDAEHIDWWGKVDLNDMHNKFFEALLVYDLEKHSKILQMTSENAAHEIGEIDILHIDGHRSEQQTLQDVELYVPKVVSGGYIWMADTLSYYKQSSIDVLLEQCDVVNVIDNGTCILFRKR